MHFEHQSPRLRININVLLCHSYSTQFKIICIALFMIQSLKSSFTRNYVSTTDLYIVET